MKKLAIRSAAFALILILLQPNILAHKQRVHQYVAKEAYNLLRANLGGIDIPDMASHVGPLEDPAYIGQRPWQMPYITTGAWREDVEDVVFNFNDIMPAPFEDDALIYVTHFWDADNGDESQNVFRYSWLGIAGEIGPYPNAFQKMKKFAIPNRSWILKWFDGSSGAHVTTLPLWDGGSITYTWYSQIGLEYYSLPDLYKTGQAWVVGYYDVEGRWINSNVRPDILPRHVVLGPGWREKIVWEVLGRMCHLLADMSVPAHAHRDEHGLDPDSYEEWIGGSTRPYLAWNHQNSGQMINPYHTQSANDEQRLHYLMYSTQQIADHYGSNGPYDGEGNNDIFGNYLSFEARELGPLLPTLGAPTGQAGPFTVENLANIQNRSFPRLIRATAGLLLWFATEGRMLKNVTVANDFDEGDLWVDNIVFNAVPGNGIGFGWFANSIHNIYSPNGQHAGNYKREFQKWFANGTDRGSTNPRDIQIVTDDTWRTLSKRWFDFTICQGQIIEGGIGGTYVVDAVPVGPTWFGDDYVLEGNSLMIQALPPTNAAFAGWSDNSPDKSNPRNVIPTDHTTLYATFKKHLASTSSSATGPSNQRKLDSFGGKEHAVYASGGSIWYTNNGGSGWSNETRLSFLTSAKNPCIATTYSAPYTVVHVVWEETQMWNGYEYHNVYYRQSTNSGASWQSTIQVSGPVGSGLAPSAVNVDATPVVAGSPIVIIWKAGDIYSGSLKIQVEPVFGSSTYFTVDGSDGTSCSPTIRPMTQGPYKLAYRHGTGNIYYREFSLTGGYPYFSVAFDQSKSIDLTSGYSWMSDAANPSLVYDGSRTFVAWDASCEVHGEEESRVNDGSMGSVGPQRHVLFREYTSIWQPVVEFSHYNYPLEKPSVGVNMNSNKVVLMWELNGNTIDKVSRDVTGGSWGGISILDGGTSPNLNHYVYGGNPTYAMYTAGSAAPYNIVFNSDVATKPLASQGEVAINPDEGSDEENYSAIRTVVAGKRGALDLGRVRIGRWPAGAVEGKLWVEMTTAELVRGSSRERWQFLSDTSAFSDWLGTREKSIPSDADFIKAEILFSIKAFRIVEPRVPLHTVLFSSDLLHVTGSQNAKRFTLGELTALGTPDTVLTFRLMIPAQSLRGRLFRLRTRLAGQDDSHEPAWSVLIALDSTEGSSSAGGSLLATGENSSSIPVEFALHPSYPNPFNPSTTIKFDLPEKGNVSLVVYDVLGRKVAVLVNGVQEAGFKSIQWDAANMASGIYFARFSATNASGTSKFSKIHKLVLAK